MSEFIHVEPVRYWCHKILPLVYDDSLSYMELLNKVVYKLNEVVINNNELPEYIAEQIKNYISSGEITKVVQDILANYSLNVKFPPEGITPAVGDGTADDTAAFQGCLDYAHAHGGMMVFVPAGKYLCGNLTMYSGCSIKGDGRYDTTIVMRGGVSNPFIGGELDSVQIADIGIDGNADIQVNNVDVFNVRLSNALLTNLFITDGYTLLKIQENGGDIQIDNIVFDKCVVRAVDLIKGVSSRVQMSQVICRNVSKLNGESAIRIGTDGGFYDSIISVATAPIGIEVTGNNNYVVGTIVNAVDSCKDTGENNNIKIVGDEENYTISGNYTFRANGDRVVHVDGADSVNVGSQNVVVNGDREVHIDGADSVNVGSQDVVVNGDSTFRSSGQRTEQYDQNVTENVALKKTIKADTIFADTVKPIMYSEVQELNRAFKTVPMLDKNGQPYNLLVEGEHIDEVGMSYVTFEQFGAVGDGVTDDTTAIKNAIAFAAENKRGVSALPRNYKISDTISVPIDDIKYFNCPGKFLADITGKPCLHFMSNDNAITNATILCNVDGSTAFGGYAFPAETEDYQFNELPMVGIKLTNVNRSYIRASATNCNIGIQLEAVGVGVVFNTLVVDDVYNSVIGLDLNGKTNGWVNDNLIMNGGYQIDSQYSNYNARTIAIRLTGTTYECNNNVFIKPSFETGGLPVYIVKGSYNAFERCRDENGTSRIYMRVDDGQLNSYESGYGFSAPQFTGTHSYGNIVSAPLYEYCAYKMLPLVQWKFDKTKMHLIGARGSADSITVIDDVMTISNINNMVLNEPRNGVWNTTFNEDGTLKTGANEAIGWLIKADEIDAFRVTSNTSVGLMLVGFNTSGEHLTPNDEFTGLSFAGVWKQNNHYTGSPFSNEGIIACVNKRVSDYYFIGVNGNSIDEINIYYKPANTDPPIIRPVLCTPFITQKNTSDIKITTPNITDKCSAGKMLLANDPELKTDTDKSYYTIAWIKPTDDATTWTEVKAYQS